MTLDDAIDYAKIVTFGAPCGKHEEVIQTLWIELARLRGREAQTCETCGHAVRDKSGYLWCGDEKGASMCTAIRFCGLWKERT